MSGSKNRFFNSLFNKFLGPDFERQQYPPYFPSESQFGVPQYAIPQYNPEQYLNGQAAQHTGATASGHGRQHNGNSFQSGTHASDQAHLYNNAVHNANTNTYNLYVSEAFAAMREQHTSSAPPAAETASQQARVPPELPRRQDGAASEPPPQVNVHDWSKVVHLACCDNCGTTPVRGTRWRCVSCRDHDVCNECKNNGGDEGHTFRSLPSAANPPLQLASLGDAAASGSQYGIMSQLVPGCMVEMCETPRLDPLVRAARAGHFNVCKELMERLGLVYPPQCISAAINAAQTAPGFMGPVLARYMESQATLIEQQRQQKGAPAFGAFSM
ncbi:hypothetical protein AC578_4001 [Pseudocercospora eumusae]|uniref:ZZ-type domain-containing protein n=1 Tax=Pseudocercospora eumusae TaxID=321146 RepID=A0A139HLM7_9PEZI|nr:hypothetical protein AC578_4001 [Pseudocercospora eumusae]